MKIKTNELTGSALDWAVAKCEGYEVAVLTVEEQRARWFEHVDPERLAKEQRDFNEYIAPTLKPKLTVIGENGYKRAPTHQEARMLYRAGAHGFHGTVSAEVAGIIATTFALNGMLWRGWDSLNAKYELLQEFIGEHLDAMTIRRALD